MSTTLQISWPALLPGSEAWRYARAFEARLGELGVSFAAADADQPINGTRRLVFESDGGAIVVARQPDAPAEGAAVQPAPQLFDLEALMSGTGTALACRADPTRGTYLVFADGDGGRALERAAEIREQLAELSPYDFELVVVMPTEAACAATPAAPPGMACCHVLDPALTRRLLVADAALVSGGGPRQDLFMAVAAGVPALVQLPDGDAGPNGVGLAVRGASPREIAGLLVLLSTEPGVRRKVLDAQENLWRELEPENQRQALAAWLAGQGVDLPAPARPVDWVAGRSLLRVEGVFDSSYSLAIVNRQLAMALEAQGEKVGLFTYEQGENPQPAWHAVEAPERLRAMWEAGSRPWPPAVSLRNAWPPVVRDMRGRRRVLASYAWEETAFPAEFAADFNLTLDLITAVSTQTARVLRDAGVSTPIAVVGNGVDHLLGVNAAPLPRALPAARFRFLHVSSCFPRKGVDVLLEAYGRAFRALDDVALVIKTFPNPHNDVREQLERRRQSDPTYPRVELIEEDWTAAQIVGLYEQCHALVAPSRGEGFGLPIAEAMLHGVPVIVTGWGGHLDFCRPDTCWLIDYRPERAKTHIGLDDSLWAEPDAAHLATLMRELRALPAGALAARTSKARERVLGDYTWAKVAERTRAALRAVDARPGLAPELSVAWVSTWGSRCGIAAYSQHLIGGFAADDLHIFAPHGEATEQPDQDNVVRNWVQGAGNLDRLVADILALAPSAVVLQYHWGFFGLDALAGLLTTAKRAGIKVYVDLHNTRSAPPAVASGPVNDALAGAERLLVHTLDDMQHMKRLGLADNVTLFPLAVYPVPRPAESVLAERRRRLGLDDRQVIASYGFLLPHKGLVQLVEAMPALLASRPSLHLLMVNAVYSPERSGDERQRLVDRIAALGLEDHVTLQTDFLPEEESLALLGLADLVIFPYQMTEESSSAAVRMALTAGRPTAVTPLPIFADVAPAVSQLPGTEPTAIAAGVASLLADLDQPERRAAAEARARDFVASRDAGLLSRRLRSMIEGGRNDIVVEID